MNLILFRKHEIGVPLPREDVRAKHMLEVLRRVEGEDVDVGLIDGPRGKAVVREITPISLVLEFCWGEDESRVDPISLIVGLARPQTCRKVLREATAMGVKRMLFALTERAEPAYATSKLWTSGEYERHVLAGLEQASCTRFPQVRYGMPLTEALGEVRGLDCRYALDNYEHTVPMNGIRPATGAEVALVVGSERGWSGGERQELRDAGFVLAGMGQRALRTSTAVVAALALTKSAMGSWR